MKYRRLGRSGLKVSEIALGGWLTFGAQVHGPDSIAILRRAFELGINFFDGADIYAEGRSEMIMGEALSVIPREQLVIATKARGRMGPGPNCEGLSRKHIIEACHASLRRLRTDYIDLYQLHWPDAETPMDETMSALDHLVRSGKVLYVGCSNFPADLMREGNMIAAGAKGTRFISAQPIYNMLWRTAEFELFPALQEEGMGAIVYCPLAQGVLTGKYTTLAPSEGRLAVRTDMAKDLLTAANLAKVNLLRPIAAKLDMPLARLALAWVLRRREVSAAIIGASSVAQLETNVTASGVMLSPDVLQEIDLALSVLPVSAL